MRAFFMIRRSPDLARLRAYIAAHPSDVKLRPTKPAATTRADLLLRRS